MKLNHKTFLRSRAYYFPQHLAFLPSSLYVRRTFLYPDITLNITLIMTSPPDSGGLFFSSSPTRYNSGPAEEVEAVLAQVQKIDNLDPSLNAVICANRSAFFETFSRRIELIKSRSQAFQDHHITIYDKVLLTLTQNGKVLDNTAAISFYCEEHLGIPNSAASAQKEVALTNALIAPAAPTQGMI